MTALFCPRTFHEGRGGAKRSESSRILSGKRFASSHSRSISSRVAVPWATPCRARPASTYSKREMNFASVPRSASSGGIPSFRARFAVAKRRSPSSSSIRARSPEAMASSSSPSSSATLARAPEASGQSNPIRLAFSVSRSARAREGSSRGTPSSTLFPRPLASFSFFFSAAHWRRTPSASRTAGRAGVGAGVRAAGVRSEHVRVPGEELLGDGVGDAAEVEAPLLLGDARLEDDLQEEVAELLAMGLGVAPVDRLEHLVGLLEDVGAEGGERLLPVPGAPVGPPEAGHDGEEALDGVGGPAHRRFLARNPPC